MHDVRGLLAVGDHVNLAEVSAGIGVEVTDAANGARFHDLLVEGSDIYAIDGTGIFTKGKGGVYPRDAGWDAMEFTSGGILNGGGWVPSTSVKPYSRASVPAGPCDERDGMRQRHRASPAA